MTGTNRTITSKTPFEHRRRAVTAAFAVVALVAATCAPSRWGVETIAGWCFFSTAVVMTAVGALGRLWAGIFIAGRKSTHLVTCGPYSLCRNPLYFFSAVAAVGVSFSTSTFSFPLALCAIFALYYPALIAIEERRLHARHGKAFEEYRRSTPAFWPRLSNYQEPVTYEFPPRVMRKNIVDAVCFWLLLGAGHILAEFHSEGLLPAIWKVW
ncbi:hypothetical protein Pan44_50980 [Caulifigura coniformis]|uniref:Isoprenylcysteine carboxyl methyltransferase (ICMT) family protein n=2 Tax=Caulifigura coniformis TaxID=2527983 RepID=A0A517SLN2_9PLAN|nr:hypothetical protein Pan44_50980 [Caulifigura coniformis]